MEVKDIQPEGIKLIKSARGLMHWEIRIDNLDIDKYPNNQPVADFYCSNCKEEYELKSKQDSVGD